MCAYNYKTSLALMSDDRHFHYGIGGSGQAGQGHVSTSARPMTVRTPMARSGAPIRDRLLTAAAWGTSLTGPKWPAHSCLSRTGLLSHPIERGAATQIGSMSQLLTNPGSLVLVRSCVFSLDSFVESAGETGHTL